MHTVTPKVFLVAQTEIQRAGMMDYLEHVGGLPHSQDLPHTSGDGVFDPFNEDNSPSERLAEFMGRLCYRSWKPELNPNVTKVREGNDTYLANVIKVKHGSVLEHASASFVFADVSRVFTHELVRHRVGVGISQESLRFVRLTDLGQWLPTCIREDEKAVTIFTDTFEMLEELQLSLAQHFKLDDEGVPFSKKKEITSAMRRIAPIGLATTIGWTANMRTLRFVLGLRTHRSAEEEIRLVFDEVGKIAVKQWPNLFQDFKREEVHGIGEWTSENWKI